MTAYFFQEIWPVLNLVLYFRTFLEHFRTKKTPKTPNNLVCEKYNYICFNNIEYALKIFTALYDLERFRTKKTPKTPLT